MLSYTTPKKRKFHFFPDTTSDLTSYDPNPRLPFTTASPTRTPPPTPTEEDQVLLDNLDALLFELFITVYREHLCRRHYTRQ